MDIKTISWDEMSTIKVLWEGLNAHHHLRSTNFKHFYETFTFEKRIESLKKRDRLITYVAYDKGESIGYCIASVDDLAGEIDSIYIQAQYRRTGIGTELITRALQWLENQDCETIRIGIAQGNEVALDFYRKFGFSERMVVMQKTS